ncbi:putative adhesin, partial [Escherichia coli]
SKLEEEMMSQAIYRKEYATSNEKIKNYALYHHEQAQNIIQRHQDGLGNKNIDIAFITDKNHKKHLSDIFKVINESGVKYDVIHFGACRVNREER